MTIKNKSDKTPEFQYYQLKKKQTDFMYNFYNYVLRNTEKIPLEYERIKEKLVC